MKRFGRSALALLFFSPVVVLAAGSLVGAPPIHPLLLGLLVCGAFAAAAGIRRIMGPAPRERPGSPGQRAGDPWDSYRERVRMLKDLMGLDRVGF